MRQLDCQFNKVRGVNIQNYKMNGNPTKPKQQISKTVLLPQKTQDLHQFEVICRVRPLQQSETVSDISINEERSTITIASQTKNLTKEFQFNKIYNQEISQKSFAAQLSEQIFKYCRQSGKSSLIFSYGVTNSGKTYSILGTQDNPGLLPHIIQQIQTEFPKDQIKISAIQIYNDEFYSLKNKQKLFPRERGAFYQFDEYQPQIITKQSTRQMMKQYIINRYQTDTKSNKKSSRSHAIFKVETQEISIAIIDLAGSERLNKAETNKQQTASINLSLLTLGKCIHAIRDRISIPYRQSKLTRAIVEYFTPQSKIYMIAHINRSGQMFHQNVNVLQYAAVSTQVKQLNPHLNYSIVKSVHKKIEKSKSKSCLNKKKNHSPRVSQSKKQNIPKSAKLIKEDNSSQLCEKIKQFDKRNEQNYNKNKKQVMQNYINRLKAKKEDFDFYLDCQFEIENTKDIQFIEGLKKARYESPQKQVQLKVQIVKAESRIKLRKEILQQIEREKQKNQKDNSTEMGPSMRKCLQESIFRERKYRCETERKNNQVKSKQCQQNQEENQVKLTASLEAKPNQEKQTDCNKQSYLKRILTQSKKMIGNTINNVAEYIRSHSRKKQNPHIPHKNKKFLIDRQFQFDSSKEQQMFKRKQSQQTVKQANNVERFSRGIGSFNIRQLQTKQQSNEFSDLLKDLTNKSFVSQDQSLLLSNLTQIQCAYQGKNMKQITQIRQSSELHLQNSPFFNNQNQTIQNNLLLNVKQIQITKGILTDSESKHSKVTKNTQKCTTQLPEHAKLNNTQQTTQGSDWDNQTSKESVFSLKTTNNYKPKKTKKTEMKFYIQGGTLSPLKTRNQKAKAALSKPKC